MAKLVRKILGASLLIIAIIVTQVPMPYVFAANGVEHFQVDCLIDDTCSQHNKRRVKNTLEMFRIEEIYSAHESLELRDLVELSRAYPNDYIENLIQKILGDTGLREEDAYRLLFGIETLKKK